MTSGTPFSFIFGVVFSTGTKDNSAVKDSFTVMTGATIVAVHIICGTDFSHLSLHGETDVNVTEPAGKLSSMKPVIKGHG
jgi:hypothetical protein